MSKPARVWTRFTKVYNGKELKFRIQEMPDEKSEEMLELFYKYYTAEEPVHKAAQITKSERAFNEYKQGVTMLFKDKLYQWDMCCLDDDSNNSKIVAGSFMILEKKGVPEMEMSALEGMIHTEEMKLFFKISLFMAEKYKVIEKFNLEKYYDDRGIFVHEDYRGLGIAGELFKARMVTCKEHGVPMTGAWMTSIGSQKAAAKLGWETVYELNYKDLEEMGAVAVAGPRPIYKLMVTKV